MKKKQLIFLSLPILLYSCTVVNKTNTAKSTEVEIKTIMPNQLLVDLNVVGEKSSGTATESGKLISIENLKQNAIADALKKTESDVLIEPIYNIVSITEGSKRSVTISVTGYPAKYKNFRTLSVQDTLLLNLSKKYNSIQNNNGSNNSSVIAKNNSFEPKKKRKFTLLKVIGGSYLAIAVIALIAAGISVML